MRLTLRTLLAYLDDILDASDAEELGKKIEESEFASGLVHRIRSSSRRLRLGAPSLEGKGMGLDPNTVAEYLDNVLPPDRVPDLEKVCLESDVHLAEIASCHQILTLVLGEPAEFDPHLREHVYRIGNPDWDEQAQPESVEHKAQAAAATTEETTSPPSDAGSDVEAPPVPVGPPVQTVLPKDKTPLELPDYLRASRRSKVKPLAITVALAFLLSAVALRAMGPFNRDHPLMRLFGGSTTSEVAQTTDTDLASGARQGTTEGESSSAGALVPAESDVALPEESSPQGPIVISDVDPDQESDTAAPPMASTDGTPATTPETAEDARATVPPAAPDANVASPTEVAKADTNLVFPPTEPITPKEPARSDDASAEQATSVAGPDGAGKPSAAAPQTDVGYVKLSDQHFLVRLDPASGAWYRLPARTNLASGDELRVLPTYRPEIVLTPGVQVVLTGPSSVRPLPRTEQGEPGLLVEYGRVFVAAAGATIHLDLGGRGCVATFADTASEMAVEVRRYLPPGTNPELEPAETVVRVFTTVGRIEWQDGNAAAPTPIEAGQFRILIGGSSRTVAAGELPAWLHHGDLRDVDREASTTLVDFLTPDRPITLSLKERTKDRRSEVRSLASRSLAYFDLYEALVGEFGDERQRSYWASEFDVLRDMVSHGAETASRVRETLESTCGDDAVDLYRLVWGYSPQQLKEGGDAKLVDLLDHDSMNVRVFASENLRRITDRTHHFRPEGTDMRRRSSVQDWREELEGGTITWNSPPTPFSPGQ
jgi:hypothetical protein